MYAGNDPPTVISSGGKGGGVGSESGNKWQLTKHGGTWGDELREIIQVWSQSH